MELIRVLGVGIVGTILAMTLSRHNGGYGLLTGLATGCLLILLLLGQVETLGAALRELAGIGGLSSEYLGRVVRILGLACLTEAGSRICRDGGQGNIALKVELCGRAMILCAALPAVREVLRSVQIVLSESGL
jgi:stage III sporulation protein AD